MQPANGLPVTPKRRVNKLQWTAYITTQQKAMQPAPLFPSEAHIARQDPKNTTRQMINNYHTMGIFRRYFSYFSLKIGSDTSCNYLLRRQLAWGVKSYFLEKNKKYISKCCLLKLLPSMQSVKHNRTKQRKAPKLVDTWSHKDPNLLYVFWYDLVKRLQNVDKDKYSQQDNVVGIC